MGNKLRTNQGLEQMVKQCRNAFRRPENTKYYNDKDYQAAERRFVKYCLLHSPN